MERAGVPGVAVLRNGVPTPDPMRGPVLPVALVAGRISPEKGTDAAIRVARRAGLAVLLAGDVYDRRYFGDTVEPMRCVPANGLARFLVEPSSS